MIKIISLLFLLIGKSHAIIPMESLALGNLEENYTDHIFKSINSVFEYEENSTDTFEKIALYRGGIYEGKTLRNYCKKASPVKYVNTWELERVKRSVMASMQYFGLDVTVKALAKYAMYFEIDSTSYDQMMDSLVKGYCSQNISVISLKHLRKNIKLYYNQSNEFRLPEMEKEFYPKEFTELFSKQSGRKNEFKLTIELFKSFCSWGGDSEDARLMVPILKDPVVFETLIRKVLGKKLVWNNIDNNFTFSKSDTKNHIICEGLVCRKKDIKTFKKFFPRSIGSISLHDDFRRLYCQEFEIIDYQTRNQVEKISKIIKTMTLEDQFHLSSQFHSLITNVPDYFVWSEKYDNAKNFTRSSVDNYWNRWAVGEVKTLNKDIYFESPLSIEIVDRELYFDSKKSDYEVRFDVNQGEFDRTNQMIGKVQSSFRLNLSNKFIRYITNKWINYDPRNQSDITYIKTRFRKVINEQVMKGAKNLPLIPWKEGLSDLVVDELLAQFNLKYKNRQKFIKSGMTSIEIKFLFGPFALKYMNYLQKIKKQKSDLEYLEKLVK